MTEIPYTVELRRDTGQYNSRLGMWLFLASEVMLFGALFTSYLLLRLIATDWPAAGDFLHLRSGIISTLVMLSSSITILWCWKFLEKGNFGRFRILAGSTVVLGAVFLLLKGIGYSELLESGGLPSAGTYFGIYFSLTGLHALHVIGGVALLVWYLITGSRVWERDPVRFTHRLEIAGWYWHFVDLVWLCIFSIFYLT